jgi:hypothetical protein
MGTRFRLVWGRRSNAKAPRWLKHGAARKREHDRINLMRPVPRFPPVVAGGSNGRDFASRSTDAASCAATGTAKTLKLAASEITSGRVIVRVFHNEEDAAYGLHGYEYSASLRCNV